MPCGGPNRAGAGGRRAAGSSHELLRLGSEEAARGFFTQELEGRVTALYRMRPTIDYVDIAGIVDNTSVKG